MTKSKHSGKKHHKSRFVDGYKKKTEVINPIILRNQLVEKYNQMVREGDPATKELRREIHEQIRKIESSSE